MIQNPIVPVFNLGTLIGNLIAVAIIIASLLTFLYLILGGFQWITSGGDKAGLEQAKDKITNALVGLVLVLTAWAIMTLAANFLGFPFPSISLPRLGGGVPGAPPSEVPPGGYVWGGPVCPPETIECPRERWQQSWCAGNIRCICGNDLKYHVMSEQVWPEKDFGGKKAKCLNGQRVQIE
jgi:hypothetical protein